jgi:predicted ester cyclase
VGSAGSAAVGSAGSAADPAKEAPKTGKELAAAYLECAGMLNAGKMEDFKTKCLAPTFVGHEADSADIPNADTMVTQLKETRAALPDMKLEPQLVLVNGRNILAIGHATGTHTAPMGDIPPTNKKVGLLVFARLTMNDENRTTEQWSFMDPSTLASQLGLLPKELGAKRAPMEKGLEGAPIIEVAADDPKEKANVEVVKQANAAFNAHKVADALPLFTDDAVESDQASNTDDKGKKGIEKAWKALWKAFPDFKIDVQDVFAAGDHVAVLGSYTGTNTGDLGPKMKKTGKPVNGKFAEVYKLKDGKIVQVWRFRNAMAMATQLGLVPGATEPAGAGAAGSSPPK